MSINKNFSNTSQFLNDIKNLTSEYTKINQQDKKDIWSILLNYLQNESNKGKGDLPVGAIGHDGFLQSDIQSNSIWKVIDSTADLDNDEMEGTLFWFSNLYAEVADFLNDYWNSTYYTIYPSEAIRDDGIWNDSLEYFLKYFYQFLDPTGIIAYEKSGYLVQNDDESINTDYLRASIPVSGGVSLRIIDVKNADAGFYFSKESEIYNNIEIVLSDAFTTTIKIVARPWVIPWYNINGHTYSYVRDDDKNIGVLSNEELLQFTRERYGADYSTRLANDEDGSIVLKAGNEDIDAKPNTTSTNPYIRLIMPEYKRQVEIEDLDRNFWVIAQIITAISAYLFDEDSPIKKMFKELLNEVMQLWENILYLWATVAGLGAKIPYIKVHTEVIYLPNSEEQSFLKYDNFTRRDSSAESYFDSMNTVSSTSFAYAKEYCKKRLRYLIQTYTESNLVIVPIIRINNYEYNYYKGEYYPFIMVFNRNEEYIDNNWVTRDGKNTIDYEFSDSDIIQYPGLDNGFIISIGNRDVFAIHENESTYDFAYPFDEIDSTLSDENGIWAESIEKYYGILRTVCNFINTTTLDSIIKAEENSIWQDELQILVGDVAAALYNNSALSYKTWYSCNNGIQTTSLPTNVSFFNSIDSGIDDRDIEILRGYYQGELISDYKLTNEISWDITVDSLSLIPYLNNTLSYYGGSIEEKYDLSWVKNNLSIIQTDDVNLISAYIKQLYDKDFTVHLFYGSHAYDTSYTGDTDQESYYDWSNGYSSSNNEDTSIELFSIDKWKSSQGVSAGAVIYLPYTKNEYYSIPYENFYSYSDYWSPGFGSNSALANSIYDIYYKKSDNKITKDNWLIVITQIGAVCATEDECKDAEYYFSWDTPYGSYEYTHAILVTLAISYFLPSENDLSSAGTLYEKFIIREDNDSSEDQNTFEELYITSNWAARPSLSNYIYYNRKTSGVIFRNSVLSKSADFENHWQDGMSGDGIDS